MKEISMTCREAAEFVSALYDGETIPRTAAEHIGGCRACQGQLKNYLEIGVELRRVASLDIPVGVKARSWEQPQRGLNLNKMWRKGCETMRIPRFTFALMSAGLVVLASSLAVVGVRARGQGSVVMLHVALADGASVDCALSTEDKSRTRCGALGKLGGGKVALRIDLLGKEGDRVELGVRSKSAPFVDEGDPIESLASLPEKRYWFEPGDTLTLETDAGTLPVTGEWMDHVPVYMGAKEIDPIAGEFRMVTPLLLRNKAVVGDLGMSGASVDNAADGIEVYLPGAGRFRMTVSPVPGAVAGQVRMNRLSFESGGNAYELVTGAPITRAAQVWVVHEPEWKPAAKNLKDGFIGSFHVSPLDHPTH